MNQDKFFFFFILYSLISQSLPNISLKLKKSFIKYLLTKLQSLHESIPSCHVNIWDRSSPRSVFSSLQNSHFPVSCLNLNLENCLNFIKPYLLYPLPVDFYVWSSFFFNCTLHFSLTLHGTSGLEDGWILFGVILEDGEYSRISVLLYLTIMSIYLCFLDSLHYHLI